MCISITETYLKGSDYNLVQFYFNITLVRLISFIKYAKFKYNNENNQNSLMWITCKVLHNSKKNNVKGQTIYKYKGYGILNTKIKVRAFKYIYSFLEFQSNRKLRREMGNISIRQRIL